jgi:hypothetical protein
LSQPYERIDTGKEGAQKLAITELSIEVGEQDHVHTEGRRRGVNPRDVEWQNVTNRLAEALGCLEEGHYLCLEARGDSPYHPYYVQIAADGDEGFRVEAVSNRFLKRMGAAGRHR